MRCSHELLCGGHPVSEGVENVVEEEVGTGSFGRVFPTSNAPCLLPYVGKPWLEAALASPGTLN